MKKNNKKILLSIGAMGAIAPLASIVSCGENGGDNWKLDPTKKVIDDITFKQMQEQISDIKTKDQAISSKISDLANRFEYKKEQKASIKRQLDEFKWRLFQIDGGAYDPDDGTAGMKKGEIAKAEDNKNDDLVNDLKDEKEKINKKIEKLKKPDELNFDSSSFKSDFPLVLLPIDKIQEKQEKIFKETKDAFVKSFPTVAQGEEKWIEKRKTDYKGATTDDEAIDSMISGVIQTRALSQLQFEYNKTYTYEKKKWAGGYDFLDGPNVIVKTNPTDADVVYYLGTKSYQDDKIVVKDSELAKIKQTKFNVVKHALIGIHPNANGFLLPWQVGTDKDDEAKKRGILKNLFNFQPNSTTAHNYDLISDLYTDDAKTDRFISQFAQNSDGTKNVYGSLGVSQKIDSVKNMVLGFGLGILDWGKGGDISSVAAGSLTLDGLVSVFEDAYTKLFSTGGAPTSREEFEQKFNDKEYSEIERILGAELVKFFDADVASNPGRQLVYPLGNSMAILISTEFGIHIVKYEEISSTNMRAKISEELTEMTKDEEHPKLTYHFDALLPKMINKNIFIENILKDTDFVKFAKSKLVEINSDDQKNYMDAVPKGTKFEDKFITEAIRINLEIINGLAAQEALEAKNKITSNYIAGLDKNEYQVKGNIKVEEIYEQAYTLAGGK